MKDVPPDQMLGLSSQLNIAREVEGVAPVDDLAVGVVRIVGAERRPTDQTLEHDGAQTPPVAAEAVAVAAEDLRGDIVRRAHGRVRHDPTGLTPGVNRGPVADRQVYLVQRDRVPVARLVRLAREQFLVVRVVVQGVEAGREAEVGQLDVAVLVKEDVVRFDVPRQMRSDSGHPGQDERRSSIAKHATPDASAARARRIRTDERSPAGARPRWPG